METSSCSVIHLLSTLELGGAERFVIDLCVTQKAHYRKIAIVSCGSQDDFLYKEALEKNIDVHILPKGRTYRMLELINFLHRNKSETNVLHIHSRGAIFAVSPIIPLLKMLGWKIIYTRHGCAPLLEMRWRMMHKWVERSISWASFVSNVGMEIFSENQSWPSHKMRVISNGVFVPEKLLRKPGEKLRLGSVGRLVALKGQKDLLKAVSLMGDEQKAAIEIHFFGDGPDRQDLERISAGLLPDVTVVFHGAVSDREAIYAEIDLLIVCSETEGLSLAIMEALARKIPVIATDVGDSSKLVIPDYTGQLFSYGDVSTLSNYITQFLGDRDRLNLYGENGRDFMQKEYSMEKTHEAFLDIYTN